jgi:hypothetical protein
MQMQPYHNARIIFIISDLYFTKGASFFVSHFRSWFPTHEGHNGEVLYKASIAMVALIAIAISVAISSY